MNLKEDILNLFGLQLKSEPPKENLSGQLTTGIDDDGSISIGASSLSGSFGTYLDVDGQVKTEAEAIRKYREISLFSEVDVAIQEIINEAIPQEQDTKLVKLNLDNLDKVSDKVKELIQEEFDNILALLQYDENSADYFKRWYIDGRLAFQIIVDKDNLTDGINKLILLDAQNVKKMKEVTKKITPEGASVIDKVDEFYLYSEMGFGAQKTAIGSTSPTNSVKISKDSLIHVSSGLTDLNNGMVLGYLHKALRPINQLRMLEDATVVYFIARAPERRIFYIDVGNLPKLKAEQYLKDIMNRYRNKMVYDPKDGSVKSDKKYNSMLEDFWLPRRDGGKGTEITQLPGAQNITGYLDSLEWFKEKVYDALNIPKGRLQQEGGFSLGRSTEISRDEVKFQKFIDRLRNKFGQLLLDALKIQLTLKQVCNSEEWEDIKPFIKLDFQKDNFFAELKEQEVLQSRFMMLQQVDNYLQKYISKAWVQKNVLRLTDEEIVEMDAEISSEANDDTAKPDWMRQGDYQMQQQQDMMQQQGGSAGFGGDGQDQQGQPTQQQGQGQQFPQFPQQNQ